VGQRGSFTWKKRGSSFIRKLRSFENVQDPFGVELDKGSGGIWSTTWRGIGEYSKQYDDKSETSMD